MGEWDLQNKIHNLLNSGSEEQFEPEPINKVGGNNRNCLTGMILVQIEGK